MLHHLVNDGPTKQRDLSQLLRIERATMSSIVATLVRKGLVAQAPDAVDQRQRILSITEAGQALWRELPDPVALARAIAFDGVDAADLAIARDVLKAATQRLLRHTKSAGEPPV